MVIFITPLALPSPFFINRKRPAKQDLTKGGGLHAKSPSLPFSLSSQGEKCGYKQSGPPPFLPHSPNVPKGIISVSPDLCMVLKV